MGKGRREWKGSITGRFRCILEGEVVRRGKARSIARMCWGY
jgi:hypothetical protein